MTLRLLPDVEALVVQFLLDQTEITDLVGQRVYSLLPKDKTWPLVRVTRFGGFPVVDRPLHLDAATLQIEAFGGPRTTCWRIAETCRAVLAARLPSTYDDGTVTGVELGGLADVFDETVNQNRWLFTATVYVHPRPAWSGGS